MQLIPTVNGDDANVRAAAGFSAATLSNTASYTVTAANVIAAGGELIVNVTSAGAAVDVSVPSAATVKGARITLLKPSGNTNAVSFLATNSQTIEGGTANKRWQNVTNEQGASTIWSDGANWRVLNSKGTWVANNS